MSLHLQRQIAKLKKMILALGAQVEEAVSNAIKAIQTRDADLAEAIIAGDAVIDVMEIDIEEECLHALALHQPVAFDLRYVVAVLKINNELERIGDLATNIAEQARFLTERAPLNEFPFDLPAMAELVRSMVNKSLDALVHLDVDLAHEVRSSDDRVDAIHRDMYRRVEKSIRGDPEMVQTYIHALNVSRNLERMADHAVNVAEDVLYMANGDILRHKRPHPMANGGAAD
jgi:phosphate transport system protein